MGTIHVVATPIGNLEDMTLRALRVLREADLLFAEDTRRTRILLEHYDIPGRPLSLNAHNERGRIGMALERLAEGGNIALVSDAGTPLISDPGGQLVAAAVEAGHELEAVPGASAVLSALTVSGLATQPFTFLGFLPRKAGARRKLLEPFRVRRETLVIFESPRRVACTLAELAELLGNERPAAVARELTKLHQEVARGGLSELAERFAQGARGEFTLVVGGETDAARASRGVEEKIDIAEQIQGLVAEGRRPREIATQLAANSTLPRREIYALALAAKEERSSRADASVANGEAKD